MSGTPGSASQPQSETNPSQEHGEGTPPASSARSLALAEKDAARRVSLSGYRGFLIAALALYVISLLLPFKSGVLGFQVLFDTESVTIVEKVFAVVTFLGLGLFNLLLLISRRTWMSYAAWFFTGVGLFYSLFTLWMRGTQSNDNVTGIGVYLTVLGVLLATFGLSCIILRRDPEQQRIAQERAETEDLDVIAQTQRDAMLARQRKSQEAENPLFVDDRRARAGERHRRRAQAENNDQQD
ncbi:Rv2732c family membrane protein [Corynebacterium sp. A21]|uniref:Rv2732c family membrane protein n=1 Tax=Corynebacterium sp. A21 TaxID=3457318 RepID=UPI003FD2B7B6